MGRLKEHLENVVNKCWNYAGRCKTWEDELQNAVLGLGGEAGEVVDLTKKFLYHTEKPKNTFRDKLILELGDIFFYTLKVMDLMNISLKEVLDANKEKLMSRHPELGKVETRFAEGFIQ